MKESSVVLLFMKSPQQGNVKSRLADAIGEEMALDVYRCFVLDILETFDRGRFHVRVHYTPFDSGEQVAEWLGDRFAYVPQTGDDLGERMKNAFLRSFAEGMERALLIGSDIPDLGEEVVKEAFFSLEESDAVIGPAFDGGYYLIGFRRDSFFPDVFNDIPWSTRSVFSETMERFAKVGKKVRHLPEWGDVDTIDDLRSLFQRSGETGFSASKTMSFLTRNEERIFGNGYGTG